jgi:hypothetical protein
LVKQYVLSSLKPDNLKVPPDESDLEVDEVIGLLGGNLEIFGPTSKEPPS